MKQLEDKLFKELNDIKTWLKKLNPPISNKDYLNSSASSTINDYNDLVYYDEDENNNKNKKIRNTKIYLEQNKPTIDGSKRNEEISKYNGTVYINLNNERIYTYYWKISNVSPILKKTGVHLTSQDFEVLGEHFFLNSEK